MSGSFINSLVDPDHQATFVKEYMDLALRLDPSVDIPEMISEIEECIDRIDNLSQFEQFRNALISLKGVLEFLA